MKIPPLHITERIWLRAFGTPPKFLAMLGTSDTLRTLGDIAKQTKEENIMGFER
jgi:hypothetical protein